MGLNGTWTGEPCFITTAQSPCPSTEMLWTRNRWGGNYTAWTCVIWVNELNNVHVPPLIFPLPIKPEGQNSRATSQMLEHHVKVSIWLLLAWDTNTSLFLQIKQHGEKRNQRAITQRLQAPSINECHLSNQSIYPSNCLAWSAKWIWGWAHFVLISD